MYNFKSLIVGSLISIFILTSCQYIPFIESSKEIIQVGNISGKALIPSTDKNWVGAKNALVKIINEQGEVIKSDRTNSSGQFLISDIPVGKVKVNISTNQASTELSTEIKPGLTTSLELVKLENSFIGGGPITVTGKVVDQNNVPILGATVADVTGGKTNSVTTTNSEGKFSLIVDQLDKAKTLEITAGSLVSSTTVTPDKTTDISITLIANSRVITGQVLDSVNKKIPIKGATVTVRGTSISTVTDEQGKFTLRGVGLNQLTLEASGIDGYMNGTTVINAVSQGQIKEEKINIYMTPIGSLRVNFKLMDSFIIKCFDEDCSSNGPNIGICTQPKESPEYDNIIYTTEPLDVRIMIEGTTIKKDFIYPPTPTKDVMATCGEEPKKVGTVYLRNYVASTLIDNIPGGIKHVTISMAGMETQKGIEVVIPANDIISTELILLHPVSPAIIYGDITGRIVGVDKEDLPNVRVNALGISEAFDMTGLLAKLNYFPASTVFGAKKLEEILNSTTHQGGVGAAVGVDNDGRYLLTRVPSGTRIIVAGVYDPVNQSYDIKYISKAIVLLNVVGGTVNTATDIYLEKHSIR